MVKRVFKLIFDFEQLETWLNDMASQGWMMESFFGGLFQFSKGTPREYTYRVELLPHLAWSNRNQAYLHFVEESDVEIVSLWVKWVVYRRKTCEGWFDVYTDVKSRIAHYRRVSRFLTFFCLLEWSLAIGEGCIFVHALVSARYETDYYYVFNALIFLLGVLIGFLIFRVARRANKKYKHLKREEPFLE